MDMTFCNDNDSESRRALKTLIVVVGAFLVGSSLAVAIPYGIGLAAVHFAGFSPAAGAGIGILTALAESFALGLYGMHRFSSWPKITIEP